MLHKSPLFFPALALASLLIGSSPLLAQDEVSEQAIRQTISMVDKIPDAQIQVDSPLFATSQQSVRGVLKTLIGQTESDFVDTFFIEGIQTIRKRGSSIELVYARGLSFPATKLPASWKTQVEKALTESGSQGGLSAISRQGTIKITVNSKEVEIEASGVTIEIGNAFLFFGATLESPSAKLVRRDKVLGLEVGLLPRFGGGIFSGSRSVSFIPLSALGPILTVAKLNYPTNPGTPFPQAPEVQVAPQAVAILNVDPTKGSDTNPGTVEAPLKTITRAIALSSAGTKIMASAGTYTEGTGETFPLVLKNNTSLVGSSGVVVQGGGRYLSPSFAGQNVTLVAPKEGSIEGVTVSNTTDNKRGYGLWLESSNALIKNSTFANCALSGVLLAGKSKAQLISNTLQGNRANGIDTTGVSEPLLQGNTISGNGTGISVSGKSRPFLENNQISQNRYGVTIESEAFPRLRNNTISQNKDFGVAAIQGGKADMGGAQDNNVSGNRVDLKFLQVAIEPPPKEAK